MEAWNKDFVHDFINSASIFFSINQKSSIKNRQSKIVNQKSSIKNYFILLQPENKKNLDEKDTCDWYQ
jgi:hypothetical protein